MENSEGLPPIDELEGVEQNEENVTLGTAPATAAEVGVVLEEGTGVDDELDDEADVEGAVLSSVQVAPTGDTNPIGNEDDPMLFIQLGDRVVIDSKKYGRTIGQVYYRSLERISVKPDGVSNMLHDFEVEQTDDEELYNEEDGVTAAYVIEKRKFESFVEPFIIMLTVPMALSGALFSLWYFNETLNIFSQIGMIMLIGLVTKNGILIIEFANQLRKKGLNVKQALIEASTARLRPILMTSLATALGALPIAISLGAAATSRKPLGTVIVGGLMFSLILTLFVIPAVYTYVSSKHKRQVN
jgi:hypothetical protein